MSNHTLDRRCWLTSLEGWMSHPLSRMNIPDDAAAALCARLLRTKDSFAACRIRGMRGQAYLVFEDRNRGIRWGRLTKEHV